MNSVSIDQLMLFVPAAFLVGASPGANNLLAFLAAVRAGWQRAAVGVIGRIAAWGVLVVLVSLGLDALLRTSEIAFVVLKWLGVGYLLYLAWSFWNAPVREEREPPSGRELMRREFLTLLGNPKAYLLLTAFLPQFVDRSDAYGGQLLVLGCVYLMVEAVAAMIWIAAGSWIGVNAWTPARRQIANRVSACLMGGAAVLLTRTDQAA